MRTDFLSTFKKTNSGKKYFNMIRTRLPVATKELLGRGFHSEVYKYTLINDYSEAHSEALEEDRQQYPKEMAVKIINKTG